MSYSHSNIHNEEHYEQNLIQFQTVFIFNQYSIIGQTCFQLFESEIVNNTKKSYKSGDPNEEKKSTMKMFQPVQSSTSFVYPHECCRFLSIKALCVCLCFFFLQFIHSMLKVELNIHRNETQTKLNRKKK